VEIQPWFVCSCGRNVRRLYHCDDVWACRYCHKLTYASHLMPDKRHWTGAGAVLRLLHELGSDSVDPFTPLPARRPSTWRKKYDRLARAFRVAQDRFLHSLVGAANKSIAQQKHQVFYGRLTKQVRSCMTARLSWPQSEKRRGLWLVHRGLRYA
jgi:hypothetical protein